MTKWINYNKYKKSEHKFHFLRCKGSKAFFFFFFSPCVWYAKKKQHFLDEVRCAITSNQSMQKLECRLPASIMKYREVNQSFYCLQTNQAYQTTNVSKKNDCRINMIGHYMVCELHRSKLLTKNTRATMITVVYENMIIRTTVNNLPTTPRKSSSVSKNDSKKVVHVNILTSVILQWTKS